IRDFHVTGVQTCALPIYNYQTFKASLSGRPGVVYVGANDGMLHAFNADTGKEMWAYVPSMVLPHMKLLADSDYANRHRFFVDGRSEERRVGREWVER